MKNLTSVKTPLIVWLPTAIAAVVSFLLLYYIDNLEKQQHQQNIEVHSQELLNTVRVRVENTITQQIHLFEGIVAGIAANPDITDEKITRSLATVMQQTNLIRSIGVARKYVVTNVYPLKGNEAAIGLNYLKNPKQLPSIQQAIDTKKNVISDPVNLVQGGVAVIVRMPVFSASADDEKSKGNFWGILSILIDMEKLYAKIDQDTTHFPLQLAISSSLDTFNSKTVFYGDASVFSAPSNYQLEAHLPNEKWLIAATLDHQTAGIKRQRSLIIWLGTAISVLVIIVTFFFSKQYLQQRQIIDFQNQSREQIWHAATHDRLTGMANRHLFNEELKRLVAIAEREKQQLAVLFLDLDRFKEINDSFGHSVGDIFLKQFSERLKSIVRESELVARLGGDEFAIVAINTSIDQAADLAMRISQSLNAPIDVEHHSLHGGVSVGISMFPDDGQNPETLTHHADLAMYSAKDSPLSSFSFFENEMNKAAIQRKQLVDNIREGMQRDEFYMAYQPIVNIQTGECCGLEALARWDQPKEGVIPPCTFIPAAESSGLIIPLGEWIMSTAITETLEVFDKLAPASLSINLSPIQLYRGEPIELIQRMLKQTHIKPEQLDIEITESTILEDVEVATNVIHQIRKLGISVTIDDFGTGYSSLSHLQQLPVNRIKIDTSFVRKIGEDSNSEAIIKAILFLSDLMKVRVTAEGVETEEQLEFLKALGCEEVQGYYFSKPIRKDLLLDFCQKKNIA